MPILLAFAYRWACRSFSADTFELYGFTPPVREILVLFTLRFQLGLSLRFFLLQGGNLRPVGGLTVRLYLCRAPLYSRALRCTASVTPPLLSLTVCCNYSISLPLSVGPVCRP